ncbi:hypothetical protein D3C81_1042100 [compost metagenome]
MAAFGCAGNRVNVVAVVRDVRAFSEQFSRHRCVRFYHFGISRFAPVDQVGAQSKQLHINQLAVANVDIGSLYAFITGCAVSRVEAVDVFRIVAYFRVLFRIPISVHCGFVFGFLSFRTNSACTFCQKFGSNGFYRRCLRFGQVRFFDCIAAGIQRVNLDSRTLRSIKSNEDHVFAFRIYTHMLTGKIGYTLCLRFQGSLESTVD